MYLLVTGISLWIAIHVLPSLGAGVKQAIVRQTGLIPYRAGFAVIVSAALTLIVLGWRSTPPQPIYLPLPELRPVTIGLSALAIIILCATGRPSRISRLIRFPQLTGMLLWACAHLLANGDNRSVLLFGGFIAWSVLQMILIKRREPEWIKPGVPGWGTEFLGLLVSAGVVLLLIAAHPWFTGMPVF
jgi:uncharacterized membrane protein